MSKNHNGGRCSERGFTTRSKERKSPCVPTRSKVALKPLL